MLARRGHFGHFCVYPFLADYQQERVTTFLNPAEASEDDLFNIEQAEISVGSGGLWGKGYMQGTQSQLGFLRVQHTDFIFSMITEEMGLIFGSLVVIGLLGFILLRILRAAALSTDFAGKLICIGIAGHSLFPDSRQHRHERAHSARDRADAAFCQLWRQFTGHAFPGDRHR